MDLEVKKISAEEARERADHACNKMQDEEFSKIMLNIHAAAERGDYYVLFPRISFGKNIKQLKELGFEVATLAMPDEICWSCIKWDVNLIDIDLDKLMAELE